MPYQPFTAAKFSGLNLRGDPDWVGPENAVDLLNVDLDREGRVRSRDGYVSFASPSSGVPDLLTPYSTKLLLGRGGSLDSIDAFGTVTNVGSIPTSPTFAKIGTPSASYVFFAGSGTLCRRYDGSALANSVGRPVFLAVAPVSNRLVQANFGSTAAFAPTGANGTNSTVFWSDPGAPETFGANNFVHLHPGDQEEIFGMVSWRELLFVFKESRMFVFYSESSGGDGNPIFNYRTVDLPSRHTGSKLGTCAGADGVYFTALDGIYRTTGGVPERMSTPLDPAFDGSADADVLVDPDDPFLDLSWAHDRLWASYSASDGSFKLFVWDRQLQAWSLWMPGGGTGYHFPPVAWPLGATSELYTAISGEVFVYTQGATTDDGTAIASHWQSGFYEIGESGKDAYTRWTRVWGSGAPTVSVFTDHATTDSLAGAVTLGTAPAIAEGFHQKSYKGRLFSHKLSSASGAWSVNRLHHDVSWVRP